MQAVKPAKKDAKAKAAFEHIGRKSGRESLSSEVSQKSRKRRPEAA